ncbi:MAG: M67 family metallopeptidase [Proteobacteria bacterium]|nr:M67 family metallopeptidase [Pseudomonadota bacterium]
MIHIPGPLLAQITGAAEAAYPKECCGLLTGRESDGGDVLVTRVAASPNVTEADARDSFLVDAKIQFDLMRELGDGPERIVGHYHSHPDHPAQPSDRDRQSAFYPDHVWVIVGVDAGRAGTVAAYRFDGTDGDFQNIPLAS